MRLNRLNVFRPNAAWLYQKQEVVAYSFSDDFARSDGAIGNDWDASATWAILSGVAKNTPVPNATNVFASVGGFEGTYVNGVAPGWTVVGVGSEETTIVHGGVSAQRLATTGVGQKIQHMFSTGLTVNEFYIGKIYAYPVDTAVSLAFYINDHGSGLFHTDYVGWGVQGVWNEMHAIGLATATGWFMNAVVNKTAITIFDDFSVHKLPFTDLIATRLTTTSNIDVSVDVTKPDKQLGVTGIIACLDDKDTPTTYLLAYIDCNNKIHLRKCVSGASTPLITPVNITYVAGKTLRLVKSGTSVGVFYDGVQKGDTITVSDVALYNNKRHGLFSADQSVSLDNLEMITPDGDGGLATPAVGTNNIFAIGDSITAGGLGDGWVYYLTETLKTRTGNMWFEKPLRWAEGGMDTAEAVTKVDGQLTARSETPTYILILLGTNDFDVIEADWKDDYRYILNALHTKWASTPIYCAKSYRDGSVLVVNPWIDDLIAEHTDYLFDGGDIADVLEGNEATLTYDGLHPNVAGHTLIGEYMATVLGYPEA